MKPKVVIIGHSYTSRLGLIRSVGLCGYDVTVIVTMYGKVKKSKPLDCYSKYVHKVLYCGAKDREGLISLLLSQCKGEHQKAVLIPDSDWSAAIVDGYKDELNKYFLLPHTNIRDVEYWMDKKNQKLLAAEVGLVAPNATPIHIKDANIVIPNAVEYPCFTKALLTMGGGKQCFKRCDNPSELRSALSSFAHRGFCDILVEDYIDIEKEYAVVGYSNGQQVIIPAVIEFIENCKSHNGIARKGTVRPILGFEDCITLFKEYVKRTGFVGLFDIDFFYSQGAYVFGEMNFRFGGSGYAVTKMGVNLPAMFVQDIFTGSRSEERLVSKSIVYVNERMCLDDFNEGHMSWCEYRNAIKESGVGFIHDKFDIKPQIQFNKLVRHIVISRMFRHRL